MVVREVIVNAFYQRVKAKDMTVEELPIPYQPLVQELIDIEVEKEQMPEDFQEDVNEIIKEETKQ